MEQGNWETALTVPLAEIILVFQCFVPHQGYLQETWIDFA